MSKTITLAPAEDREPGRKSFRAVEMRRTGASFEQIAADLSCSTWDAAQLLSIGYAASMSETGDQLRASSEDRILGVIRSANRELLLVTTPAQRLSVLRLILDADARLSKLYGLELPTGLDDAPEES